MKLELIYNFLDELSPFSLQEKWDNSGLLVGNLNDDIKEVHISIDLDEEMLALIPNNSLIITHHPLIFKALKTVNYDSYSTKLLKILIQKNIALISMHTNIDVSHLNKYVAQEILGLEIIPSEDFIVYAKVNMPFDDFSKYISEKLNLSYNKVVKCSDYIQSVALVTGAGMSFLEEVKADCFLTGDIKYHEAMEAKSRKISLIDIRHYESEQAFSTLLMGLLEKYLENNKLKAIITASKNPFVFCKQGEPIE
ncbi:MAG: Nif3-like dinuclear metal center hexameric protein [Campylobacteraceae bacterium]|nr:Nif3-like dinuclear metal center hexameric protein [Campylobacteraceae bacterium]